MRAFRPPADIDAYMDEALASGGSRSALIVEALGVLRDARRHLGADWHEVVRLAAVANVSPGRMLARLARRSLRRQ